MRKRGMYAAVLAACVLTSLSVGPQAAAAPLAKDPPAGYETVLPNPEDHGVLVYEDFEKELGNAEGRIGRLEPTTPEEAGLEKPTIEITDEASYNGKKCLKVSNRGTMADGTPMGYNTINFENVALDISTLFVKDPNNKNKSENYYFSAYVRNVDPSITQYFYVQLQYGGSGEVWLPDDTYFKVEGEEWVHIGGEVRNGAVYYYPFVEDTTGAGIYAGRTGITSWSSLRLITRNPVEKGQPFVQTNGDYYIDDVVFWRAADTDTIVKELPKEDGKDHPDTKVTLSPVSQGEQAPASREEQTPGTSAVSRTEKTGMPVGVWIAVGVAAAVVIAGGGVLIFWIRLKKTKAGKQG